MKCFSFLIILLFISVTFAQDEMIVEENIFLSPHIKKELKNGDKAIVEITSKFSESELKKYVNKTVANQFYIISFFKDDNGKFYEVFVLNPVQQKQDPNKPSVTKNKFTVSGEFKFEFDKERLAKEFMILDVPYVEVKKTPTWYYVSFTFLALLSFALIYNYLFIPLKKKAVAKSRRKLRAENIINQLDSVKTRADFENIYKIKNDLDEFLEFDNSILKKFYKRLNSIQYKEEWTTEEKESLDDMFKKLGDVKFKDGI